jgi:hypothetical protein
LKRIAVCGLIGWATIGLIGLFLTATDYHPHNSIEMLENVHYFAYIPEIMNYANGSSPFNTSFAAPHNISIAIVSLVTTDLPVYRQMGRYSFLDKIFYSSKQQYSLFIHTRSYSTWRKAVWGKMMGVHMHLSSNKFDWILWVDLDTVFIRSDEKIETIICDAERQLNKTPDFIITRDQLQTNAGVFLVRNSKWSLTFLEKMFHLQNWHYNLHWAQI